METASVEEVVGEFVTLKKRGANLIGLCPFHNEKTPSFTVSPSKGIYKCFGCGAGGGAVNFIMEHEHYTFPEALRYLANKYSIEIEEEEMTPEMEQEQSERDSQYIVVNFAQEYFIDQLHNSDEGKAIGLTYLRERGLDDETIKEFKLGYGPEAWDHFTSHALGEGYKLEYLVKTGLTKSRDDRNYDGYRGRIIFPIHNLSGRAIGFGGRILKSNVKAPKYVNTPECDIYHKSKVLYGLFFAKKTIIAEDNCYLVEGYTDVISMYQSGIENVVASSGTSLTQDQIRLIKRYTPNITILYDGDPAGIKASFRGIDLILEEGMNVKVVLFPEGEDPDSYAQNHSGDELKQFIESEAKDFIVFKTGILLENVDDPIAKSNAIREVLVSVASISNSVIRSNHLQQLSKVFNLSEQALLGEMNKIVVSNFRSRQKQLPEVSPILPEDFHPSNFEAADSSEYQERDIIRLLLNFGNEELELNDEEVEEKKVTTVAGFLIAELNADDLAFENAVYKLIFEEVSAAFESKGEIDVQQFTNHQQAELSMVAIDLLSSKYELHDWQRKKVPVITEGMNLKKAVHDTVYAFKSKKVSRMIFDNQKQLKRAQTAGEDVLKYLEAQQKLDELKKEISEEQGRVILK